MDRNSEARWYFAESTDRSAFYDLFFQICQQYHVDWATGHRAGKSLCGRGCAYRLGKTPGESDRNKKEYPS